MGSLNVQLVEADSSFRVKVVPGSSKTGLVGILDAMLKVKVSATAEKGKANRCLISFLAKKLGVKIAAVTWGYNSAQSLKNLNPDYLCDDPEDLFTLITSINAPTT